MGQLSNRKYQFKHSFSIRMWITLFLIKEQARSKIIIKAYLCVLCAWPSRRSIWRWPGTSSQNRSRIIWIDFSHVGADVGKFAQTMGPTSWAREMNWIEFANSSKKTKNLSVITWSRKVLSGDLYYYTNHISVDYGKVKSETSSAYDRGDASHVWRIVTRVEACLNSRPLYPISSNPKDLDPMTPGHFLNNRYNLSWHHLT